MSADLIKIFEDTKKMYESNPKLIQLSLYSKKNQKFIGEHEKLESNINRFSEKAELVVSKCRTFQAAEIYSRQNMKVAVLNFANSYQPGGGVLEGARSQEECLCRISTLYDSLTSSEMEETFYEPHKIECNDIANDDLIYTPDVVVFKTDDDNSKLRPEDEWFLCDVITCAAPCLGWNDIEISDDDLYRIHESRARHILDAAALNKVDAIVLGAFGCGAFSNPPEVVAKVYKSVIEDYRFAFRKIDFAIFCRSYETENYKVFNRILNEE